MKKQKLYLLVFLSSFILNIGLGQVGAPSLRCLSVNNLGNVTLTWQIPPDPLTQFTRYEIYSASTAAGPFNFVANVTTYTQTNYLHATNSGSVQSQYYYLKTIYSGTVSSSPSDTLRTLFLNLSNSLGQAVMNWNATRTPLLPSASNNYTLEREDLPTIWTNIYSGSSLNFNDIISVCNIFYHYKIKTSDAVGCISESNIDGGLFTDKTVPDIPHLDSVSVDNLGQAQLGWKSAIANDTKGYNIYKFNSVWTKEGTVIGKMNTSFTNTASIAGTMSEKYCIAAFDSCGNEGLQGITNDTEQSTLFLKATYNFCSRSATLNWNAYTNLLNNVLLYDVYCSVNGGTETAIASGTTTSYTHVNLNPSSTYNYFIRVRNVGKTISAKSNQVPITANVSTNLFNVYIRSVSVNLSKQIEITYSIDNSSNAVFKGITVFRSIDGFSFQQIGFQAYSTTTTQTYVDAEVNATEQNYYYKIQISDDCGNPGEISNTSKSILLKVSNDEETIFNNILSWDDYSSWKGNVISYNIYRSVNGIFGATPIANVSSSVKTYTDDVQDYASAEGKFIYYVEAVEDNTNPLGFMDKATSNTADVLLDAKIFIPTAFAPNGINKIWMPVTQYVEKTDYRVTIYNRWGTKVFETNSDKEGWNGEDAPNDIYAYHINFKNARGKLVQLRGFLNLIK